jgi:hypothetical protein
MISDCEQKDGIVWQRDGVTGLNNKLKVKKQKYFLQIGIFFQEVCPRRNKKQITLYLFLYLVTKTMHKSLEKKTHKKLML